MKSVASVLFSLLAVGVFAESQTVGDYTWQYSISGQSQYEQFVCITGVSPKSGDITVPSELGSRPVKTIGSGTFENGVDIDSITVPDGITQIDQRAFYNCSKMSKIVLPATVGVIGPYAFSGCQRITDATLPSATTIYNTSSYATYYSKDAFPSSDVVTNLVIAEGSKRILNSCFSSWTALESVSIPDSVTNINAGAFSSCCSLKQVTIPSTVKEFGEAVFNCCVSLTDVYFTGNAPKSHPVLFAYANDDLVVRVPKGSRGWDGNPSSTALPKKWPSNTSGGRPIVHIGDVPPEPEPTVVTNYVFTTVTNHVYHHDIVTDMTAYYTTVTNVHVHCIQEPTTPEFIIPSAYDTGFVNVVCQVEGGYAVIPATWSASYPGFTEKYGSDFSKALSKPNGKYDQCGNPMYVWQDYVAGTSPMDVNDIFYATISIVGGKVKVSYTPKLDAEREALRVYTVYGKRNLMDSQWEVVEEGSELEYNFYRVTVRMK